MVTMTADDVRKHAERIDRDKRTHKPWNGVAGMADGQLILMFKLLCGAYAPHNDDADMASVRRAVSQ